MRTVFNMLCSTLLAFGLPACGDDDARGGAGQPCYPDQTCSAGLVCVNGVCADEVDYCGDGVCDDFEDASGCPADCGAGPVCGDDSAEGSEACDGADLGGETCARLGYDGGTLACMGDCSALDTSACYSMSCGNGQVDAAEVCDGTALAGEDCTSQGFYSGTLACSPNCDAFDTTGCNADLCGNDAIDAGEACDGVAPGGEDCASQGFTSGYLACAGDCQSLDTSSCNQSFCDNTGDCTNCQQCAINVTCDSQWTACLNNPNCTDLMNCSFQCAQGDTACENACAASHPAGAAGFDSLVACIMCTECFNDCNGPHWCAPPSCGNGQVDAAEVCDGTDLAGETCMSQGFFSGPLACTSTCATFDTSGCDDCGNGAINPGEVCDGSDLGGETCASQGFNGGLLTCATDCLSLDASGCAGVQCDNSGDCTLCQNCAGSGPCNAELSACFGHADCLNILTCAQNCSDMACISPCIQQYPAGQSLYFTTMNCFTCEQCYVDCNGPIWGCL